MNIFKSSAVAMVFSALGAVACSNASSPAIGSTTEALVVKTKFEWNGGGASAFAYSASSNVQLNVSENLTKDSPRTAYLSLWGGGSDPTSQVCTTSQYCDTWDKVTGQCLHSTDYTWCSYTRTYWLSGYGEIPSQDFLVDKHGAHLSTNLANDPGLYVTRCTSDTVQGTYTCEAATGTIDVTWTDNGNYSSENDNTMSATYTTPYRTFKTKSSGSWTSNSANFSGTVLGTSATGAGDVSQSKGKSVSKEISEGPGGGIPDAGGSKG